MSTSSVGESPATTRPTRKSARVGTAGFEPATPATPLQCATGLRHVPYYEERNCIPAVLRTEALGAPGCAAGSCKLRGDTAVSGGRAPTAPGPGPPPCWE